MAGNQAGKSNPASKRMMSAAKKAKRVKNKRKNEAMSGLLSDREYRRHQRDFMYASEMAAREKNKCENEAMSGLLSDSEYLMYARWMAAREKTERTPEYVHHKCDICHSRRNHHVPKKEAPYTYDFGKWMANQHGTPGALEQERIMGSTIHYINEHPRATEARSRRPSSSA